MARVRGSPSGALQFRVVEKSQIGGREGGADAQRRQVGEELLKLARLQARRPLEVRMLVEPESVDLKRRRRQFVAWKSVEYEARQRFQ